ncbi:MAG: DUF4136 domain-containing protein [Bacteroidota bacterium]
MKKLFTLLFAACLVHGLQAQYLVSYDHIEDVDMSQFKTYHIDSVDIESIPDFQPRKEGLRRLLQAISNEMDARGYQKQSNNPDLLLNVGVTISEEVQTRETDIRDAPRYIGTRNYHWQSEEIVVREYEAGTVTLDMVDVKGNQMIWQSIAKGTLTPNPKKANKRIDKAAQRLFQKFPVKP